MQLEPTEEQKEFGRSVRDALIRAFPPERLRDEQGPELRREQLAALGEIGLLGACVSPEYGGLGLGTTDIVVAVESIGYAAPGAPCIEPLAASVALEQLGTARARALLASAVEGGSLVGARPPGATLVAYADEADALVLLDDGRVTLLERGEWTTVHQPWLDEATPLGSIETSGGEEIITDAVERVRGRAAVLVAALQVGVGARLVELSTRHALEREQFGVPIGSFQAIKHQLADALLTVEIARPVVWRASWSDEHRTADAARDAAMARVFAGEAATKAAHVALQVHGAVGYTHEHPVSVWLKAAWGLDSRWGTTQEHRERLAALVLADSADG
jgi:alkylation response protein AidB-like acyl-CoA dehydrogenase